MHDKPDICAACGGQCCKQSPGAAFPEDFGLPATDKLKAALKSGKWCFDWWEGDPRSCTPLVAQLDSGVTAYFIRPALVGYEGRLSDASWGGTCCLLTPSGCSLKSEDRPLNCRALEPVDPTGKHCRLSKDSNKQAAAVAWLPYNKELEELKCSLSEE